jgi:hypothetical protein
MVQIGRALTDPKLDPPIRALVVYNSNPAVIAPSQNLVLEGLRREDLLTVVVEQLLTDTARFADYVFPATSQLEHLDLLTSWGQEYLSLNQPAPAQRVPPTASSSAACPAAYTGPYPTNRRGGEDAPRSKHPYLGGVTYAPVDAFCPPRLPEPWLPSPTAASRHLPASAALLGDAGAQGSTPCLRTWLSSTIPRLAEDAAIR